MPWPSSACFGGFADRRSARRAPSAPVPSLRRRRRRGVRHRRDRQDDRHEVPGSPATGESAPPETGSGVGRDGCGLHPCAATPSDRPKVPFPREWSSVPEFPAGSRALATAGRRRRYSDSRRRLGACTRGPPTTFSPSSPSGPLSLGTEADRTACGVHPVRRSAGVEFLEGKTSPHRAEFEPDTFVSTSIAPKSVLDAVKKGDTITWGACVTDSRKPAAAPFEIVAKPAASNQLGDWQAERRLARAPGRQDEGVLGQEEGEGSEGGRGQVDGQVIDHLDDATNSFPEARRAAWPRPHGVLPGPYDCRDRR